MGITLKQLTDTVSQIKDYILNKTHKIDQLNYAQKTVNTSLEYAYFTIPNQTRGRNSYYNITKSISNGIEYTSNSFWLKAGKTYKLTAHVNVNISASNPVAAQYVLRNKTNTSNISNTGQSISVSYNSKWNECDINCIYCPEEDCEIALLEVTTYNPPVSSGYITVQEIGHDTLIDPVEYINKTQGLEDSPVGHIISHMGTTAPKHYLICDGAIYNIVDYPYLAQHMIDNFGKVNYFGGDGIDTFAVPDLRGEFLRGTGTNAHTTSGGIREGSGASVGKHQGATILPHISNSSANIGFAPYNSPISGLGWGDAYPNTDAYGRYNAGKGWLQVSGGNGGTVEYPNLITTRPTNTSVLYCIKYEPTYYMQVKNTNYMQPNLYSEEERIVGCWINGKPLYEKTVLFTLSDTSNSQNVAHNIENIEEIVYSDINIANGTIPIGYRNNASTIWFTASIGLIFIELLRSDAGHWGQKEGKAVIQYTKTTDAENSFTNDMIQDYIIQSSETEPYSEEEVTNAVNEIWQ